MRTIIIVLFLSLVVPAGSSFGGTFTIASETDTGARILTAPFDLRDRESFIQVTNVDSDANTIHFQIYNVANLCNENNFFDNYTPNDTHVYNLRDILTNDGNPSGVVLPDDAYGIIFVAISTNSQVLAPLIGNIRITDNSGYEYRSNINGNPSAEISPFSPNLIFNYSSEAGVILSDVFGMAVSGDTGGATIDNVLATWVAVDVDIVNNNEVLFSCRDVVFSCVDENNPLIEEILALASQENMISMRSSASVARYEYGINDVIPNSKGGELLCPGNNISEGEVILTLENFGDETLGFFGYVGLNNGNGRGSMDSLSYQNGFIIEDIE